MSLNSRPDVIDVLLCLTLRFEAQRDAARVSWYLWDYLRLERPPCGPLELPGEFLLELAGALRLLEWEIRGLIEPGTDGLPRAREAISGLLAHLAGRSPNPVDIWGSLYAKTNSMLLRRFAWGAAWKLNAPVALEHVPGDVLDELAGFLFRNRHRARA